MVGVSRFGGWASQVGDVNGLVDGGCVDGYGPVIERVWGVLSSLGMSM